MVTRGRNERGFTIIELILVIVVLAIMAAIAIPKFLDIRGDAKKSAIQGALGGVRSAVANYKSTQIAKSQTPEIPTLTSLTDGTSVLDGVVPDNPYYSGGAAKNSVGAATSAKGTAGCAATPLDVAWCYTASTGDFWAASNTSGVSENGF